MRMPPWFRRHRIAAALLWTALTLGAIESILLYYYLSSWVTLPSL
jgi:hypothetical protein